MMIIAFTSAFIATGILLLYLAWRYPKSRLYSTLFWAFSHPPFQQIFFQSFYTQLATEKGAETYFLYRSIGFYAYLFVLATLGILLALQRRFSPTTSKTKTPLPSTTPLLLETQKQRSARLSSSQASKQTSLSAGWKCCQTCSKPLELSKDDFVYTGTTYYCKNCFS
ncbi:MAG: hypothetical protein D6805_05925 [Planctomycetota bacterium]|nr:MAG: hypothetical protein D6805_05925 [Planctomycetota bacterium]